MNDSLEPHDSMDLLLSLHEQIHDNIQFADQKSSALIAADGALLALTYTLMEPEKLRYALVAGIVVSAFLVVAIGYAFLVVKPRAGENRRRGAGVVDPVRICAYSFDEFQVAISTISNSDLLQQIRTLVYDRASINEKKYHYLRISLSISLLGWISALMFAIWAKVGACI